MFRQADFSDNIYLLLLFCCYYCLGEYLEFLSCHPDNEHWWMAKNENDEIGYVPSSYVIMKEDQVQYG